MKKYPLFLAAVATLLVTSCASPIERRVAHYPDRFAKLPAEEKENVRRGMVREGMSKDGVFLAWGKPDRVTQGRRDGKNRERWSYVQYEAVQHFGYGGGFGFYGTCGVFDPFAFGGPVIDYVPTHGRMVEFADGKVVGFMIPR